MLDGRYRIDAVIGSGGMGRVYRGEHTGIGRAVAIKVLHHDLNRNREASARFQREAIASGRLDHPNIVNIYDFGVLPDRACYLVMELLEGETLGERLQRDRVLPWREAVEILRGVLLGLRHAHDRGVVHRDIKPDNVYLARKDGDLIIKILDFGIAKLRAGSADDPASTRAGLTVGTPAYLSPEQAVGGEITPASDLYSASIVLYEMLAGRAPFEEKDPLAMLGAHVSRQPPAFAETAPGIEVPEGLEGVIHAGLVKASAERIRSSQEYIAMLDRVIATARRLRTNPVPAQGVPEYANPGYSSSVPMTPFPHVGYPPSPPVISHATPHPSGPLGRFVASDDPSMMISIETSGATAVLPTSSEFPLLNSLTPPRSGPVAAPDTRGLPPQARAVSLADVSEPIPRRWLVIGGGVVLALIIGAIILALSSSGSYQPPAAPAPAPGAKPPKRADVPPAPTEATLAARAPELAPELEPEPEPIDRSLVLKALIHDLQNGRSCADRKAAIAPLVELGEPRAIEALRAARFRMRGGIAGFGRDNHNACLVREAEAAIKALASRSAKPSTG